jgi:molybdopterin-guanine dinucleotide biosynthesis protein A
VTTTDNHQKHAALIRPLLGNYHRNELAILGTNCSNIRSLVKAVTQELYAKYNIAYVDANHNTSEVGEDSTLSSGTRLEFTDMISYRSFNFKQNFNTFQNRSLYNEQDLVLVNGNHFLAQCQIVVIDPSKPLNKKLEKLTNIQLILLADGVDNIPDYIATHLPVGSAAPILKFNNVLSIAAFIDKFLINQLPPLNGLVLAGGKSERMQTEKGSLNYFGKSQRLHVHSLLSQFCENTHISYAQAEKINLQEKLPVVLDTFTGLGPFGGVLSAMQSNPNAAWLIVACDLPYLSAKTLAHLVSHRNSSKVATCFVDGDNRFPEPLITIWEPRAYPLMLQFLSQGYSCPRKVLINADVELLEAPDVSELKNVNHPHEMQEAMMQLNKIS